MVKAEEMINTNSIMTQRLFQRNIFSSIILASHERSKMELISWRQLAPYTQPEERRAETLKARNA